MISNSIKRYKTQRLFFLIDAATAAASTSRRDAEDADSNKLYCFCRKPYDAVLGNMIECASENCSNQWYHFPCLHMDQAQSDEAVECDEWFCPVCKVLAMYSS